MSSVADGTPKFFIPSSVDEDQSWDSSTDTVDDWSDVCNPDLVDSIHNMLGSTTSLSSLYLGMYVPMYICTPHHWTKMAAHLPHMYILEE